MQAIPWTRLGTKVSLGRQVPPGAVAGHRGKLDPDGCLVRIQFATNRVRKTGAVRVCRNEDGSRCYSVDATGLRRFDCVLDSGRLMGVRIGRSEAFLLLVGYRPTVPLTANAVEKLP